MTSFMRARTAARLSIREKNATVILKKNTRRTSMTTEPTIQIKQMPTSATNTLSRLLSDAVRRSFEDPRIRTEYKEWKKRKNKEATA